MTSTSYSKLFSVLTTAYPRQEIPDGMIGLYNIALRDIPESTLQAAIMSHVQTCKWFPTIAELREKAKDATAISGMLPSGVPQDLESVDARTLSLSAQLALWEKRRHERRMERQERPQCSGCGEHPHNFDDCPFCADLEMMQAGAELVTA